MGRPRETTDNGTTDSGSGQPQGETTIRETTTNLRIQAPGDHKGRPQGETTGDHGQRIQDPSVHPPALETIYRTLKLYQLSGIKRMLEFLFHFLHNDCDA